MYVQVAEETIRCSGCLFAASGFKRLNGIVQLVVVLPDGSSGMAARTPLMCWVWSGPWGMAVVLDVAGSRELQRLVGGLLGSPRSRSRE